MTADLVFPAPLVAQVSAHAEAAYPEECCGVLVGTPRNGGEPARIVRVVEAENAAPDERRRRYSIAPELLFAVHREVRGTELDVVGYYHSHPGRPAEPSPYDLEHALPGASYLIVGLDAGCAAEIRCFRLGNDGKAFVEESWTK